MLTLAFKVNQFQTQNNSEIEIIGTDQYGISLLEIIILFKEQVI